MQHNRVVLDSLREELAPFSAQLIAVSKTRSAAEILPVWQNGQRDFGENYVQELVEKHPLLPSDIRWHFIGHLQRNKVKYIAPFVHCIHTVDSLALLAEIDKQASKLNRVIPCLLQIHIAREETKFGLSFDEAADLLNSPIVRAMKHVSIVGLMGMASNTEDWSIVRNEFRNLREFKLRQQIDFPELTALSMGMSGDYRIALQEGSTMVRIGSAIFGERDYSKQS